jgi:hypothetical protein
VLDGAGAANPVKETTCPKAWIPTDHSVPFQTLAQDRDAMPDVSYPKKGIRQPSIAKLVGRVIVAVGIRPRTCSRFAAADVNWQARRSAGRRARKGKASSARTVPLSRRPGGASTTFDAAGLRRVQPEAVSHSFKRAARRIDGEDTRVHLYSGRHTLGADLYRETRDLATVGRMLNHAPGSRATAQYAQGRTPTWIAPPVAALSTARQVQPNAPKLPKSCPHAVNNRNQSDYGGVHRLPKPRTRVRSP